MPELPDVEVFRGYANSTSLHQKIKGVEVNDFYMLGKVGSSELKKNLQSQEFVSTQRYGKYLFLRTKKDGSLVLHFGMTGFLQYFKDMDSASSHTRMLITFDNDYHLAYDCRRRLGLIDFTDDEEDFIKEKELGLDPYQNEFDLKKFSEILKKRKGSIKSTFMNQKHIAGIGNIYADEILFQAGIHPKQDVSNLKEKQLSTLYDSLKKVLRTAIECRVQVDNFPKDYLIRYRNENETCPKCDGQIKNIRISNRSTYFCSKHQNKG